MSDELVINSENFNQYFFDARTHKPQKGQVMVVYRANATLVKGPEKEQLVDLLCNTEKAVPASQIMRKLFFATEEDSVKVPLQIVEDLKNGKSKKDVLKRPYKYKLEIYYYTKPEYIPDDPHWESISLMHMSDYFKAKKDDKDN